MHDAWGKADLYRVCRGRSVLVDPIVTGMVVLGNAVLASKGADRIVNRRRLTLLPPGDAAVREARAERVGV
jgi:hypothetical protein